VSFPAFAQRERTRSPHGPLAIPCENCHTATGWRPIRTHPEFDHNNTNYPLRAMHERVQCTQCHVKPVFTDVGKDCADCHADIHRRKFGADCAQCHTVRGWNITVQQVKDHQNRFPLFGAHAAVQCEECHKSAAVGQFQGLSTQCISCHQRDYQQTTNPNHASAHFSTACETCHTFDTWLNAKFDHSTTGFLLKDGHANVPCASCHISNNYNLQIAPTDCGNSGCHLTKWQQTNNPPHSSAGPAFALSNCANCHTPKGWDTASFDHTSTGFPLTNGHANVPCASCHINGNYSLNIAATACGTSGCHMTTWQQTSNPVHSTAGPAFALTNCSNCHTTKGWDAASFDHSVTGFTLTGTHMSPTPTPCASCHINNNYTLNSADCMGCHQPSWQSTTTLGGNVPNHVTAGFPTTAAACSSCHPITTWADGKFDHSTTGFTLTGIHVSPTPTPCSACHVNGNYGLTSADCMGCHQPAWQSTTTLGGNVPNHVTSGFPSTAAACSSCHPITTWADGKFDHSTTGFPLTNKHITVQCSQCHINGNYSLNITPTDCGNSGCHLTTWQQTNNPVHSTAGPAFAAVNCSTCHTTAGWDAASFDHSVTGFTLVGTHISPTPTPCAACHINNNYSLNSADCYGCHITAWNSTTTIGGAVPNHIAAGFPNTAAMCASCHPITTWAAGKFDHSTTGFPLTGAHADPTKAPCSACHVNNNYSGNLPTDCYSCHTAAWQSTVTLGGNVPNHIAAGFPTTCATCHTTTSWLGATFNHNTYWRLPHHNAVCTDCHIDSTNYANMSCINCHTQPYHSKTQTDSQHKGRVGYTYGPMTCIASGCHPKGAG